MGTDLEIGPGVRNKVIMILVEFYLQNINNFIMNNKEKQK